MALYPTTPGVRRFSATEYNIIWRLHAAPAAFKGRLRCPPDRAVLRNVRFVPEAEVTSIMMYETGRLPFDLFILILQSTY